MRSWPIVTVRLFAIVNLLFVSAGLYLMAFTAAAVVRTHGLPGLPVYTGPAFYIRTAINLLLLLALIVGSLFLWKAERLGLLICNAVFAGELLYFLVDVLLQIWLSLLGRQVGAFAGSMGVVGGIVGTTPQLLTGYPIIALVLLNLVYRKLRKNREAQAQAAP